MEAKVKELIYAVKHLLEKAGITDLVYYEDRIEEEHETPEFYRYDGSAYNCLKLSGDKCVYMNYNANRGETYYSAGRTLKEFSSPEEALRYFCLNKIKSGLYRSICIFRAEHMDLLSLDEKKQYPVITIVSTVKAFEILQIPKSFYCLDQEVRPESVRFIQQEEGYRIQYYNSGMKLTDEMVYEKKTMENIALLCFFTSVYRLYLWKQYVSEIKKQGEDIFQIQEEDYGPYII